MSFLVSFLVMIMTLVTLADRGYAIPKNDLHSKNQWHGQTGDLRRSSSIEESFWNSTLQNIAIREAKKILDVSKNSRYLDVVNTIYKKLTQKFTERNWFVAVYDAVLGGDKHYANTCHGTWTMGYNGFNLLLASNPKNTEHLNYHLARSIFHNVNLVYRVYKGWWRGYYTRTKYAQEIFNEFPHLKDCQNYSAFGVIRIDAHVYFQAENARLATINRYPYVFFLFQ